MLGFSSAAQAATKLNPDSHQICPPHLELPLAQAQIFPLDNTSQIREPRVGLPELNFNEAKLETQAWGAVQAFLVQVRSTLKAFGKPLNISRSLISLRMGGRPLPLRGLSCRRQFAA